ncbi:MAG: hypothetical protein ACI9RO_002075, partial [Alteromonas macleodii]
NDSVQLSFATAVHVSQRAPTVYAKNNWFIHNILRFPAHFSFLNMQASLNFTFYKFLLKLQQKNEERRKWPKHAGNSLDQCPSRAHKVTAWFIASRLSRSVD